MEPLNLDALNAWFFGGFGSLTFDGRLDDVQLYDHPLTTEEILFLRDHPGDPISSSPDPDPKPPGTERFDTPSITLNTDGTISIGWLAAQDVGYRVEFSTDLENWNAIDDVNFSVNVNDATLEDSNTNRTEAPSGYYRVLLLP